MHVQKYCFSLSNMQFCGVFVAVVVYFPIKRHLLPPKNLHGHCFRFSCPKRNRIQSLCKISGGGGTRCIMRSVKVENSKIVWLKIKWQPCFHYLSFGEGKKNYPVNVVRADVCKWVVPSIARRHLRPISRTSRNFSGDINPLNLSAVARGGAGGPCPPAPPKFFFQKSKNRPM